MARTRPRFLSHRDEQIANGGCAWHIYSPLGYLGWHDKSERLNAQGVKQRQCPDCKLHFWPDEYGTKP
jgi:hypothetical protein